MAEEAEAKAVFYFGYYGTGRKPTEVFGTFHEIYTLESGEAKVTIRVPWEDRLSIISSITQDSRNGRLPVKLPNGLETKSTGVPALYATSFEIDPAETAYEGNGQAIDYQYADITITYTPIVTEVSLESTSQYVTVNPRDLYWDIIPDNNKPNEHMPISGAEAPGIFLRSFNITLSNKYLRLPQNFDLLTYEGTCNNAPIILPRRFLGKAYNFPAETLAFQMPHINTGYRLNDAGFINVSCKLAYNPLTHNKWYHPLKESDAPSGEPDKPENHAVAMRCGTVYGPSGEIIYSGAKILKPVAPVDYQPLFNLFGLVEGGNNDNAEQE